MVDAMNDFECEVDVNMLDKAKLPTHLKKLREDPNPDDEEDAKPKKAAWEDKVSIAADDDTDKAYIKVKKMVAFMTQLKLKIQQEQQQTKKARYQPDPKLSKETTSIINSFAKLVTQMEKLIVQKAVMSITKIKKQLEEAAKEYKEGQRVHHALVCLNKQ